MKLIQTAFVFLLLAAATPNIAEAAPITGSLWRVSNTIASNAIPANVPGTAPDVTFDVNAPLNFTNNASVGAWLTSGGAFNVNGSAAFLAEAISPVIVQFMGQVTVTTGMTFTVTHDDGLTLLINGASIISVPGPTGPVQTTQTYNGPSGTFPFQLVYGECCSGSAVLQISLPFQPGTEPPAGVPEPASLSLLGLGLGAIVKARRRRKV